MPIPGSSPDFHRQMPDKWAPSRIGMFTPGAPLLARLPLTFEIPLSSARATPPCPGSRASFWASCRLWPRSDGEAVCNPPVAHTHAHGLSDQTDERRLAGAFALIVSLMVAEIVAGILASSLALLSDAGHMFTDAVALGLALAALRLARRPPG